MDVDPHVGEGAGGRGRLADGRAWMDALLAVAAAAVLILLAHDLHAAAKRRAELDLTVAEAHRVYDALQRFYGRNRAYPDAHGALRLEPDSLEPLRSRGYYRGPLTRHLLEGRIDAYDAPRPEGAGGEFWMEMTPRVDPRVRILVARSDDAPLGGGRWHDGVFVIRNGRIGPG